MHIVFFVYGLAFFLFGFSIAVYPKRETDVTLARDIWLLATFGILHGLNEWLDLLLLGMSREALESNHVLLTVHAIPEVGSFLCLLVYGVRVTARQKGLGRWVVSVPLILTAAWAAVVISSGDKMFLMADVGSRYLLGLPGIALTAYALALNIPDARKKGIMGVENHLILVVGAFASYALFSGLVVPEAGFFPANTLNYRTFLETAHVPVQVLRALCAAVSAYGILWVLRVFTWRTRVQLVHSRQVLEQKILERTTELRVLNEELEHEVAEKSEYERELVTSLAEKEALLRELHHRVKNNMQIMVSLLKLESRLIDDPGYARMFADSSKRLNAMIATQERLYTAEGFRELEFGAFAKDLCRTVYRLYNADLNRIRLTVDAGEIAVTPDTIVPLGMVLHELLSNSIVHGFAGGGSGDIYISLRLVGEGTYEMVYRDTGSGFPAGFDLNASNSLGLELVKLLCTEQLRGSVSALNEGGAVFFIRFQTLQYRERI
jgi:two-component sensor histidine kinase